MNKLKKTETEKKKKKRKQKQSYKYREQTDGGQRGEGWGKREIGETD